MEELIGPILAKDTDRGGTSGSGIGGPAKTLIAKQAREVTHDSEFEHPAEWDRPVD